MFRKRSLIKCRSFPGSRVQKGQEVTERLLDSGFQFWSVNNRFDLNFETSREGGVGLSIPVFLYNVTHSPS